MSVFAAAMDRLFTHPDFGTAALWISAATSEERPIHLIARAPDRVTDFGAGRFVSNTTVVEVRVADLPAPRPGDLILIGAESHVIQGEPLRDRDRLIWTLDLRPA